MAGQSLCLCQRLFLLLLFTFFPVTVRAEAVLEQKTNRLDVSAEVLAYRDEQGELTIDRILEDPAAIPFRPRSEVRVVGYGYSHYWMVFPVSRARDADPEWWLEIDPSLLDDIEVYLTAEGRVLQRASAGVSTPFSQREIKYRHPVFKLDIPDGYERFTVYVRVTNISTMFARVLIWNPAAWSSKLVTEVLLFGGFFGVLLGVLALSASAWRRYRARVTFWWAVYLLALGLAMFGMNGFASHYVFFETPGLARIFVGVTLSVQLFAAAQIMSLIFGRKQLPDGVEAWLLLFRGIPFLTGFLAAVQLHTTAQPIIAVTALAMATCGMRISAEKMKHKVAGSEWYFAGCLVIWFSMLILMARYLGLLGMTPLTLYAWEMTSLLHIFLFAYGTVERQRFVRGTRKIAKNQARNLKAAETTMRMRQELIAVVLHEMRTPLSVIHAAVSNLKQGEAGQDSATLKRYQRIWRAQERIRHMLENYLSNERMKLSYFHPIRSEVDMAKLIAAVIEDAKDAYPDRRIEYSGIESEAGEKLESLILKVDRDLMRIALANAIDNALKYSQAPTPVQLRALCAGGEFCVIVKDSGIGIPAGEFPKIFDRYYRASSGTRTGAGLGMHVLKTIVEKHGGKVKVESTEGVGTEVTMTVPAKEPAR